MANTTVNKVSIGEEILIDLTGDDVTAEDVVEGKVFHLPSGSIAIGTGEFNMFLASYGHSTYAEVLAAYQKNMIVYARASTGSNPASGSQNRMAFLAYVNNVTTPTEFEFQYYRSVATHTAAQQGDQVYVYKLNSSNKWSVTVREAYTKIEVGTGLTTSYSNGTLTISLA